MDEFDKKKPVADFLIYLDKPDIRPWKVPMRALARILKAVQRLVDPQDEDNEEGADDAELETEQQVTSREQSALRSLRLVDVKSGSACYAVAAPCHQAALSTVKETGRGIESPQEFTWLPSTVSAIKELTEVSRTLHCNIEFRLPGAKRQHVGEVLARITPKTYGDISPLIYITGETSIFAKIERVGGATAMHCGIRLPSQLRKMIICKVVGADLVRELGRYMYQEVLLSGTATWLRHGQQLQHFRITSFEPPKTGSIMEALEKIHAAGGKAWDRVEDPDAAIAEMRGE